MSLVSVDDGGEKKDKKSPEALIESVSLYREYYQDDGGGGGGGKW